MSLQTTFENNLKRFACLCPDSVERVKNADCSHLSFCKSEKGEDNLKNSRWPSHPYYYNQKGITDSLTAWFENQLIISEEIVLIYGIGLGYHYQFFKDWLKQNPKRFLVLIDDDPAVWHRFLEGSLATEIMADSQVILIDFKSPEYDQWNDFRNKFRWVITSSSLKPTKIFAAESYTVHRASECELIMRQLSYLIEQASKFAREMISNPGMLYYNYFKNMLVLPQCDTITHNIQTKLKGLPFIICGAGPSLAKVMPLLDDLRDKAVIFAAGTAMNILTRRGLRPHFGGSVDPMEIQESRIMSSIAYEIPHIFIPRFFYGATPHLHGPLLFHNLFGGSLCSSWFSSELGLPDDRWNLGISTSTVATTMAAVFGTELVILLGMDLAYTQGERYSEGVTSHPTSNPQPPKNPLLPKQNVVERYNIKGDVITTQPLWITESEFYKRFIGNFPHVSLINCTDQGLKIDEVPTLPFSDVAKRRLTRSYDIQNWIHFAIQSSEPPHVTEKQVLDSFEKWKTSLELCLELFSKNFVEPDIDTISEEPAFKYSLKIISDFFNEIAQAELNKFDLYPENYTEESKKAILEEKEKGRGNFLKPIIIAQLKVMNKVLDEYKNHPKEPVKAPTLKPTIHSATDLYRYENGEIVIQDDELGIHFKERFNPTETFKTTYPDGSTEKEMFYSGTDLHGPSSFYTESGLLLARGWFIHGKRSGKNLQYYRTGDLYSIQRFVEGKPHGIQEYYYPNGQLKTKIVYNKGLIEGELILYYPDGKMKKRQFFKNGQLNGVEEIWHSQGHLLVQAEYKDNLPTGTTKVWHPNGQLAKEVTFYGHPQNFDIVMWDDKGKMIQKKLYLPPSPFDGLNALSQDLQKSFNELSAKLENLKKK